MYGAPKWPTQGAGQIASAPGYTPIGFQYQPGPVSRQNYPAAYPAAAAPVADQLYPNHAAMYAPAGYPVQSSMYPNPAMTAPAPQQAAAAPRPGRGNPASPAISPQQTQQEGFQNGPEKFKTELCRKFALTGFCRYGDMCQFAHGTNELRALVRHPLYKTSPCKTFETTGQCRYGARCRFIHDEDHQELATLARGVPALNLQISEPSWEEAQTAAMDAVQHMVIASTGVSPQIVPGVARLSPPRMPNLPNPSMLPVESPLTTTSPLNATKEPTKQQVASQERTLTMSGRSKTEPSELSRALSTPPAQSTSTGEIRSISSLIMISGSGSSQNVAPSPTHAQPRVVGSSGSGMPPQRVASAVKLAIDEDVFPPANLDARRLPVANSGSWVNLADMASPNNGNSGMQGRSQQSAEALKHSYSQPVLGGDTWLSSSIASLPVLPTTTSPVHNNSTNGGLGLRTNSAANGFVNSTSSPNLFNGPVENPNNKFKKAASYAHNIWFESTETNDEAAASSGWGSMARAKSVEGRLNIFRNLSDQDLAKTAQNAVRLPVLGKVDDFMLSDDEDKGTDEGQDTEEDEGFSVGKF